MYRVLKRYTMEFYASVFGGTLSLSTVR